MKTGLHWSKLYQSQSVSPDEDFETQDEDEMECADEPISSK